MVRRVESDRGFAGRGSRGRDLPWIDPHVLLPVLGAAEVLLGVALVVGVGLRLALAFLLAHPCGTFLTFLMLPGLMFAHGNPLLLTSMGEFVTKNVVLIGATLVLYTHTTAKAQTGSRMPVAAPTPGSSAAYAAWGTAVKA